jgi:hypothetical protein
MKAWPWIGRYLGIPGTALILLSLRYSLRKRKLITTGNPVRLLRAHEWMAWCGQGRQRGRRSINTSSRRTASLAIATIRGRGSGKAPA